MVASLLGHIRSISLVSFSQNHKMFKKTKILINKHFFSKRLMFPNAPKSSLDRHGFSLLELMVTIGISAVMSAIIFFNYPAFNSNVSLRRTADNIALTIREAQAYGLGVRQFSPIGGFPGYGVHFTLATPKDFVLYADGNHNSIYDKGAGTGCGGIDVTECFRNYTLTAGDRIVELRGYVGDTVDNSLNALNIVFLRPHPTVVIRTDDPQDQIKFDRASIRVRSQGGEERLIKVTAAGQISVAKP